MLANLPYILQQISNPGNLVLLLVGNIIGMIFGAHCDRVPDLLMGRRLFRSLYRLRTPGHSGFCFRSCNLF